MTAPETSPSAPRGNDARSWLLPAALVAGLYLLLAAFFVPRFETMDDIAMAMWASGLGMTLEPQSHLIFSHEWIGWGLKQLYRLWPAVAWYGWFHLATLYVSNVVFCRVLTGAGRWFGLVAFLAFFSLCQIEAFVLIQFTKTAFYATFAGLLLLADQPSLKPTPRVAAGLGLLLLGSLIRPESFVFALAVALPPLLVLWWRRAGSVRQLLRQHGAILAAMVLGPLAVVAATSFADRLGPWKTYYDYRLYRSRALDFGEQIVFNAETKPVFDRIGWTENHLAMLRDFSFYDPVVFSASKFDHLLQNFPRPWLPPGGLTRIREFAKFLWEPGYRVILVAAALLAIAGWRRGHGLVFLASWLGSAALLTLILLFLKWPPNRVILPILGFSFLLLAWQVVARAADLPRWRRGVLVAAVLLGQGLALARIGPDLGEQEKVFGRNSPAARQSLAELGSKPDQLYFAWGGDFPYNLLFLPFNHHPELFRSHLQIGSWGIHNPYFEEMMRRAGLTDLYRDLVDRPDLFLIASPASVAKYQRFMQEQHQLAVEAQPVPPANFFHVWRIRQRPNPSPGTTP